MRVIIDSKGLNESNPEAGTSLTVAGNIIATDITVAGVSSGIGDVIIYVNTVTGSDSNPGTPARPVQTFGGVIALLPTSHNKLCRAIITGPSLVMPTGSWFPPTPVGISAEPFTMIGSFTDSGIGERTSTAVSTLAGTAGVTVTDNTLTTFVDQYQMYRFRVTSGPALGKVGLVRSTAVSGAFTMMIDTLTGFVPGNKFVLEYPTTAIPYQGNTLHIQGGVFGMYGMNIAGWDYQLFSQAKMATENCWVVGTFMRDGSELWMGNLRSCYNTWGIGSQVGYTSNGQDMNGACGLYAGAFNVVQNCRLGGSCVVTNSLATLAIMTEGSYGLFFGLYGGSFDLRKNTQLVIPGFMRSFSKGISATNGVSLDIANFSVSGGSGITLTGRSRMTATGLIGSSTGTGVAVVGGACALIDVTSTISGSSPGVNDLFIGALGNRSHAQLIAATSGTLNDSATAGGAGSFMSHV